MSFKSEFMSLHPALTQLVHEEFDLKLGSRILQNFRGLGHGGQIWHGTFPANHSARRLVHAVHNTRVLADVTKVPAIYADSVAFLMWLLCGVVAEKTAPGDRKFQHQIQVATTNLCESVFLCLDQTNSRLKEYYLSTVVNLIRRKKLMAPAVTRIRLLLLTYVPADRLYERQLSYPPRPAVATDWFRQAFPEGDVEHEMSMMELCTWFILFFCLLPFDLPVTFRSGPTPSRVHQVARAYSAIDAVIRCCFGVSPCVFGSTGTAFAHKTSDVDVLVSLPPGTMEELLTERQNYLSNGFEEINPYPPTFLAKKGEFHGKWFRNKYKSSDFANEVRTGHLNMSSRSRPVPFFLLYGLKGSWPWQFKSPSAGVSRSSRRLASLSFEFEVP
ncbi:MAG: uncharacterized protein KVP18_000648 [Porospora cf. gigantea A]|uniref:uncharacterized protein n=1 Tax=Porospora cf. gigantea A TaxID=2853593 RepID=UPI003559DFC6|nr:MAG: hypothetical protein KVP18_000648 [Porospora cf. gigantea A]